MILCLFQVASIHLSVCPPTTIIPSSYQGQSLTYFPPFTSFLSLLCASSIHNLSALSLSFIVISLVYGPAFGLCSTERYFWYSLRTRAVILLSSSSLLNHSISILLASVSSTILSAIATKTVLTLSRRSVTLVLLTTGHSSSG